MRTLDILGDNPKGGFNSTRSYHAYVKKQIFLASETPIKAKYDSGGT